MKKNRMMRLASGLLVAVLITTSTISGTFAKYVTTDSANDSARVAKWGVTVTANGTLFEDTYKDAPTETASEMTVVAKDSKDVVAPGTNNTDDSFIFSITGVPEVDVKVTVEVTNAENDVFLKAGTYENLTTGDPDDETNVAVDYYPVKYTFRHTPTTGPETVENNLTLAQLVALLNAIDDTATYDANTDLATVFGEYEISWAWAFGTEGAPSGNDEADTILGDLAAGSPEAGLNGATLTAGMGNDYNLSTGLEIAIRVEQVD